jgi:hypothetical protein
MFNCATGVYVDVKSYSSFTSINTNPPVANGNLNSRKCLIRWAGPATSSWCGSTINGRSTSMFSDNLTNLSGSNSLLVATSVFRNEPYGGCTMITRMQGALGRFAGDRRGVSAVEFALLAPLMMALYLGSVEVPDGVIADRKGHADRRLPT